MVERSSSLSVSAAGDALDYEVLAKTADAFDVNVTGCRYAEFYRELGVPELGFLLVCRCPRVTGREEIEITPEMIEAAAERISELEGMLPNAVARAALEAALDAYYRKRSDTQ